MKSREAVSKADHCATGGVRAIERAVNLIGILVKEKRPLGINDLSQVLALAPSTTHRILQTLCAQGYVYQDLDTRRYGIGPSLLEITRYISLRYDLIRRAHPYLQELMELSGETANLAELHGTSIIYLSQVESPSMVRMFTNPGAAVPLYCTGVGKVFLADMHDDQVQQIIGKVRLKQFTPNTICDVDQLLKELEQIRIQRFAIDNEEREAGVRCLASGVRSKPGTVIAALSISGPSSRISGEQIPRLSETIVEIADRFSNEIKDL